MQTIVSDQERERGQRAKAESVVGLFLEGYSAGRARLALFDLQTLSLSLGCELLSIGPDELDRFIPMCGQLEETRRKRCIATARAWVRFAQRWRK